MGLFRSMVGSVELEIVSADIPAFLAAVNNENIHLFDVSLADELSAKIHIRRQDLPTVKKIAKKRSSSLKIIKKDGMFWTGKRLVKRPVFIFGCLFLLLVALFLPSRVLFIKVDGNDTIPTKQIIEKAESCGIHFGASRRQVRSEQVKNALLSKIPQLQWAGVNTSGCVATISVREKSITEETKNETGISSIVASRDGVIRELTVTQGIGTCQVGQAVKAGQMLISGYNDCGLLIQATRAEGEVYAQTLRELSVITPVDATRRLKISSQSVKYFLLIGKKQIKLYKDSGISDAGCVKMYEKKCLTLPGGFELPVALVRETRTSYTDAPTQLTGADSYEWLQEAADAYLLEQTVAGQILDRKATLQILDGVCVVNGHYSCVEMIGKVKNEEIIKRDGENN